jgi:hypothetical protein
MATLAEAVKAALVGPERKSSRFTITNSTVSRQDRKRTIAGLVVNGHISLAK